MKSKKISGIFLLLIFSLSILIFGIKFIETQSPSQEAFLSGNLIHRFTIYGINDVDINFIYKRASYPPEYEIHPLTTWEHDTHGSGYWEILTEPPPSWGIWSAWIEVLEDGYVHETFEIMNSQNPQTHYINLITPIYRCTVWGFIRSLFLQSISVELWGIDVHYTHHFCAATKTTFIGYYSFHNLEFDFAFPEVPAYYYIKVPFIGKTEDVNPYPYPNGEIRVPDIDP